MCGAGVDRVGSADLLRSSLRRAFASRRTEATGANKSSSRSHAVVMLRPPSAGLLLLVDCAGSEWASDSSEHSAARRREGAEINASLHALKQCVRKHGERTRNGRAHVPYRESLLTRILAPVFECADARLAVIGCVSPGACDAEHSIATLRTVAQLAAIDGARVHRGAAGRPPQGGGVSARRAATGVRAIVYTNFTSGRSRQLRQVLAAPAQGRSR